jgi:hypothetical protein
MCVIYCNLYVNICKTGDLNNRLQIFQKDKIALTRGSSHGI